MNQFQPAYVAQNRRIWGLAGAIGRAADVDKADVVHDHIQVVFGKTSLKELSAGQVGQLLEWLEQKAREIGPARKPRAAGGKGGPRPERKRRGPDPRLREDDYVQNASPAASEVAAHAAVTAAQSAALEQLRCELGWALARYRGFCQRQVGTPWPQTRRQAMAVHEGMEKMLRRPWPPERVLQAIEVLLRRKSLTTEWEREFLGDLKKRLGPIQRETLTFARFIKFHEIYRKRGRRADVE